MQEKHGLKMSRQELVREAKLQTDAIQRLNVWLRLGYSLVAIGFILGLWGYQQGNTVAIVGGVACLVVGAPVAAVLKVGTSRAKRNVENILAAAGVDVEELKKHRIEDDDDARTVEGQGSPDAPSAAKRGASRTDAASRAGKGDGKGAR